jgi:alkaline phosphatase D
MNQTKITSISRHSTCCLVLLSCAFSSPSSLARSLFRAQGEMAGEVSTNSAIVQTRLTSVDRSVDGDVPGAVGVARFEYAPNSRFESSQLTPWMTSRSEDDYIIKAVLRNLKPAIQYYYRVHYGNRIDETERGQTCSFRTLQGATGTEAVSLVVVTGMNYVSFHHGKIRHGKRDRTRAYQGDDKVLGYPALASILKQKPDFFVGTGDNVYYDSHDELEATTIVDMRRKWHEQFVQPRFVKLFQNVPTYWEKDDHDHRYNDCDRSGSRRPSSELGITTFREQVPIVDLDDPKAKTYRTYRVNRDLQIWLVEGRDYRSPNRMPDGPEKKLWGDEQLAWLKATLLESDATFKLLISPTPLVGPDDAYKIDNHTNLKGFRNEGRKFFQWVVRNHLHQQGFYTVCGDRHWQYHSKDPLGIEEFSCGAIVDENARLGRNPGDPKSTDPNAEIHQFYTQAKASGGFLQITVGPGAKPDLGRARFTFLDDLGNMLYETHKERPVNP